MNKVALKSMDLLVRSAYRDTLYKIASGEGVNKEAGILGKLMLFGLPMAGMFGMNHLQKSQRENFLRGQAAGANTASAAMAALYNPQGGLGVPDQYRSQMSLA